MGSVREKAEAFRRKIGKRSQKGSSRGMKIFLFTVAAGYLLFFTSELWFPQSGELVAATPYYQETTYKGYRMYLTQFVYSEEDAAMQVILEMENSDVLEETFTYTAVERSLGDLDISVEYADPEYMVLRITDVPSNWKEVSFRVYAEGDENPAKFYTNRNEVRTVDSLPEKTAAGYRVERLQAQITYDDAQILEKKAKIAELEEENREIADRMESIEQETYPTEEEAQAARELYDKAANRQESNRKTVQDLQEEIGALEERSENIRKQIQELEGSE